MNIEQVANKLNELSKDYEIGRLQDIRKKLKSFKRRPGSKIFTEDTIFNEEGYAFHYGGRGELQFNIGFIDKGLRVGIAFSLESSRSLPEINKLFPSIYKMNCIIRENPEYFQDYIMWHWDTQRSDFYNVKEIPKSLIRNGVFIFIGKILPIKDINYDEVLSILDDLLKIYLLVENQTNIKIINEEDLSEFKFINKDRKLTFTKKYNSVEMNTDINIRHSILQKLLYKELLSYFGENNVSLENPFMKKRIDIVVQNKSETYFYEIKTGSSVQSCIRQAIGQLLEYGFKNGKQNADKLFIASEYEIDKSSSAFLDYLNRIHKLPLEYYQIKI